MLVRGLYVCEIPLAGGEAFNQSTTKLMSSTIIRLGTLVNDSVLQMARALSLITRICRSISGTCSLAAVVLSVMPRRLSRRHSNSLSISAVCMVNPRCVYISKTFFRELVRLALLRGGTYSEVVNFTPLELVTMKPRPSTNITSAVIVISLFKSSISCGTLTYEVRTGSWVTRTVFPLIEATLGPKFLLAVLMSVGGDRTVGDHV
jgi:hypothetical protein